MKYLLKMIIMTIVIIPMLLIDSVRALWDLNTTAVKQSYTMYTNALKVNWYKLRGIQRPVKF